MSAVDAGWDFETRRLRIRPLRPEDEQLYSELYSDAETMRFIGQTLSPERAGRAFRKLLSASPERTTTGFVLTIVERLTLASIGLCSLQNIDSQLRNAEAGIMLRLRARANGYSTEGLGALVRRAFEICDLEEVRVRISANYPVVQRLVMSVGFSRASPGADGAPGVEIWRIRRTHGSAS